MAVTLAPFNPMLTTNMQSGFALESNGFIQGLDLDDQVARMRLKTGKVSTAITNPVYAGVPVSAAVPNIGDAQGGQILTQATDMAGYTGFFSYRQNYNAIIMPGNNVPLMIGGMTALWYPKGSLARIPVPVSAALITAAENQPTTQQVSWNFTTNELDVYDATTGALPVDVEGFYENCMTISYNSTSGVYEWTVANAAVIMI